MGNDRNDRHPRRQKNHDPDLVSAVNTPYLDKFIPANRLKSGERLESPNDTVVTADGGTTPKVHEGWMWDLTVPGNNDHDFYVEPGSGGTVAVLVHNTNGCGLFENTMPGRLDQELSTARQLGVKPASPGSAGFDAALGAGPVQWAVLEDGSLKVMPKFVDGVEIAHPVLSGGAAVRGAGEAEVTGSADTGYFGLEINNRSGHYPSVRREPADRNRCLRWGRNRVPVIAPPDLAVLDGRQLARFLAHPAPSLAGFSKGEWLAVTELLTSRLSDDREMFSADDWGVAAAAVAYVLAAAEAAGAIEHDESVIRRLNLSAAVLRRVSPRDDIPILSPSHMVALFAEAVPMPVQQARSLAADWRSLEIADIRRLRLIRNLVTPVLLVRHLVSGENSVAKMEQWEEILPLLP